MFLGYDFHLDAEGPKLIEINTNAGGALLNIVLGRAQRACCPPIEHLVPGHPALSSIESAIFQMFLEEWRLQRGDAPLRHVAIVDDRPREQYLYPEFLLFQQLFRRHGIEASILSAEEIQSSHNALWAGKTRIDLIYNRMTDFSLGLPVHAAVREAYINDEVVVTPHPRAHALYADKRNLAVLSDRERLRGWGVPERVVEVLCSGVPQTRLVDAAATDELWMNRRKFFFKPAAGFGSRAAYRGEKITRRVWQEILSGSYVAQAFVPPSQRVIQDAAVPLALKLDIRNYVYNGRVLLLAARLYQGQTTNFRTPGGGFAPVFTGHRPTTAKEDAKCGLPAHGLSG